MNDSPSSICVVLSPERGWRKGREGKKEWRFLGWNWVGVRVLVGRGCGFFLFFLFIINI